MQNPRYIGGMSLPPGFLDELRTRVTLSRIVGRKVTWDQRKSNQAKGDLWAASQVMAATQEFLRITARSKARTERKISRDEMHERR